MLPPATPLLGKCSLIVLVLFCLTIGACLTLAILIAHPAIYSALARTIQWRTNTPLVEQIRFEESISQLHLRGDAIAGNNATLLFGDSHLQGLPASSLGTQVNNYAIGGEPATRLAQRIGRYVSIQKAQRIILLSGTNDLNAGINPIVTTNALAAAMSQIPSKTPVFLLEIPPLRGHPKMLAAREKINIGLAKHCASRDNCHFVSLSALANTQGELLEQFAADDGIHLTVAGYKILAETLTSALHTEVQ